MKNYRTLFFAVVAGFSGTVSMTMAENVKAVNMKGLTPQEIIARKNAALARTGGTITIPGRGSMAFIDCQGRVPHDVIKKFGEEFGGSMSINVSCSKEPSFSIGGARKLLQYKSCAIGVFVFDDIEMPMSLISPEAGWGAINVATLITDHPDSARLARRFRLACKRVASLVASGCTSQYKGSVLQPVRTVDDLDDLVGEGYTVDTLLASKKNLQAFGISPSKKMTYHRACAEGIAPAPTNEYQKAIWDKVHEMPTAPIKILPETKKVLE